MSALLKVNNLLAIIALIGAIAGPAVGYGLLTGSVSANADDIDEIGGRVGKVEDRAGDVRERLKGIEVTQQQQNETLKRILRAVEGR